jgi:hypothetical protein
VTHAKKLLTLQILHRLSLIGFTQSLPLGAEFHFAGSKFDMNLINYFAGLEITGRPVAMATKICRGLPDFARR